MERKRLWFYKVKPMDLKYSSQVFFVCLLLTEIISHYFIVSNEKFTGQHSLLSMEGSFRVFLILVSNIQSRMSKT